MRKRENSSYMKKRERIDGLPALATLRKKLYNIFRCAISYLAVTVDGAMRACVLCCLIQQISDGYGNYVE